MPSDDQIDQLATAILARDRYRAFRPENYDFLKWLRDALQGFLGFIAELYFNNPPLYWLLVIGLLAICALLLAHMVWTLAAAMRASPVLPASHGEPAEHDFALEAQQLAVRGQHLEAAHRLLLASLRLLAKRRFIPLHPEDGNAVVCRQLAASKLPSALREQLIQLIVHTERAWFGDLRAAQLAPDLYESWRRAFAELTRAVPT